MQGDAQIIESLNAILTAELTAINQYFVHAKMLENWGYQRLAKKAHDESIDEMKHADQLIERVLYLEGTPNVQRLDPVRVGEEPVEQLELQLATEKEAVERLNQAIGQARDKSDNGTRELLEGILTSEEDAVDWLEAQLHLVAQVGRERYLAEQIKD
ncbi:MAG: bacterioferritin [Deltaproteobacteria bacterium]|nr:bacterioferritin [Deltaproteobacteria bacterium]MBW2414122.1 bacterioferritin [Deltaproteobacteria bacterium]